MINKNIIIVYDYETCSRNPYNTQPIELGAIAVEPRTLEIIPNSEFCSLIKPVEDIEEQKKLGLANIEQEALDVNHKKIEDLRNAQTLKTVWLSFSEYCKNYNFSGKRWDAPILCGFNNTKFDDIITDRIAGKDPWKYGPWDDERNCCSLFHPVHNIDVMKLMFGWFESDYELKSFSLDNIRDRLNISKAGAHNAIKDVEDTANILIRILKMQREMKKRVKGW